MAEEENPAKHPVPEQTSPARRKTALKRPIRWDRVRAHAVLWGKRAGIAAAAIVVAGATTSILVVRHYESDLPTIPDLKGNYHPPQVTRVLARDGSLLAELFTERRTVVPIQSLPPHVKLAVLAAEDANFYEHEGVNYGGILRALVVNLRAGRTKQGGSTITQQVVKNIILDPERTYRRKIREALLARKLEQELSKDEILELYLNHIYFGHGRYGIEEAARDNFGKPARELTLAEAALLAGLVAGPESFSPRKDMTKALSRRSYVLRQMLNKGFLNQSQYEAADKEAVQLAPSVELSGDLAPEVIERVRHELQELEPERSKRGGFTVTTTIDPKLQAVARKAVRDNLLAYDKRHNLQGALRVPATTASLDKKAKPRSSKEPAVFEGTPAFKDHAVYTGLVVANDDAADTFDVRVGTVTGFVRLADYERYNPSKLPSSRFAPVGARVRVSLLAQPVEGGETPMKVALRLEIGPESALVALDVRSRSILALVGNYEATSGGLDRALQSRRQPGSTFKPIVYSYAIHSRRFTPASLMDPTPAAFDSGYKPTNYEGWQGQDLLRLRDAVAHSVNVVAVRVLTDVGADNVVSWAHSLGIASSMDPYPSLALGSFPVKPIELCAAYATFASGGVYDEPRLIAKIVGPDGAELPLKSRPPERRVMDEAEAYVTTSMLTSVVHYGTGARAKSLGRPVAGKTGTTNEVKDTWFAGFSPDIAAVVWVGYDDNKPLGGSETGGSTALPAWVQFMKAAHEGKPKSDFPRPAGVVTVAIDKRTGKLPYADDPDTMDEVFLTGTEPTETSEPPPPPVTTTTEPPKTLSPETEPAETKSP